MSLFTKFYRSVKDYFSSKNSHLQNKSSLIDINTPEFKNAQIQLKVLTKYRKGIEYAKNTEQYELARLLEEKIKETGLPKITL